jgi:hypothetical protein
MITFNFRNWLLFLTLLLIGLVQKGNCNLLQKRDSLQFELDRETAMNKRLSIINSLVSIYILVSPAEAGMWSDTALSLLSDPKVTPAEKAAAYLNKAKYYFNVRQYNKAKEFADKAIIHFREIKSIEGITDCYFLRAGDIIYGSNKKIGVSYLLSFIPRYRNLLNYSRRGDIYFEVAQVYKDYEIDSARIYFQKATVLYQIAENSEGIAACKFENGLLLWQERNYRLAFKFLKQSNINYDSLGALHYLYKGNYELAIKYSEVEDTANAINYYWAASNVAALIQDTLRQAECFLNMAEGYLTLKNYTKALQTLWHASVKLPKKNLGGQLHLLILTGASYSANSMPDSAEYFLQLALNLVNSQSNVKNRPEALALCYSNLFKHYVLYKQYDEMIKYGELTIKTNTALKNAGGLTNNYYLLSPMNQKPLPAGINSWVTEKMSDIASALERLNIIADKRTQSKMHFIIYEEYKDKDVAIALAHLHPSYHISDSIRENNFEAAIAGLQVEAEFEKYYLQLALKQQSEEIQLTRIKAKKQSLFIMLCALVLQGLIGLLLYIRYKKVYDL